MGRALGYRVEGLRFYGFRVESLGFLTHVGNNKDSKSRQNKRAGNNMALDKQRECKKSHHGKTPKCLTRSTSLFTCAVKRFCPFGLDRLVDSPDV